MRRETKSPSLKVVTAIFRCKMVSRPSAILCPSGNGIRQRRYIRPSSYRETPPSAPFRSNYPASTASEIGRPAPRLWHWERSSGAASTGRDSSMARQKSRETPRHSTMPAFRATQAAKDDFISPLYAPRRRPIGFVGMAQQIGDAPPKLVSGKKGRLRPGSSGRRRKTVLLKGRS